MTLDHRLSAGVSRRLGYTYAELKSRLPRPDWDAWLADEGESSLPALPRSWDPQGDGRLTLRPQRGCRGLSARNTRPGWWRHA